MDVAALDAARIDLAPGASIILPLILAVMMFAVALGIRLEDFRFLKREPLRFIGAASAQLIALPLATLILVHVMDPVPSIALGMIVVACCPGGNVSNFLTHVARGDTALSVSLTATSSLAAALLTPISILFWTSLYGPAGALVDAIEVSPIPFVVQTTLLMAVPIALGMTVVHHKPALAARLRPVFLTGGVVGIVFMVVGGLASNWALFTATAAAVLGIAILHNAIAFLVGAAAGRALQFGPQGRRSLTFEVGIQNTGLGLVLLLDQFDGLGGAAAITALWAIWHLVSGLLLACGFRGLDLYRTAHRPAEAE